MLRDFIAHCAIVFVALSPLLWRFYMDRFWIHGRGKVIRLDGGINFNPGPGGGRWVWTPVIEYDADGQRLTARLSYWQRLNAKSRYTVGDEVDILYDPRNPSRVTLDSWTTWIFLTLIINGVMISVLSRAR
jgi:hypothetical protein